MTDSLLSPQRMWTVDFVTVCFAGKRKRTKLAFSVMFLIEAWRSLRPREEVSYLWFISFECLISRSVLGSLLYAMGFVGKHRNRFVWALERSVFVEWDEEIKHMWAQLVSVCSDQGNTELTWILTSCLMIPNVVITQWSRHLTLK